MTLEHMHDRSMRIDRDKLADDARDDLEDADDEELEDRIIDAHRTANKPLEMEDIERLSRMGASYKNG